MEVNNNKKLIERFCKDIKIPIDIYSEPYFSDRLNELDRIMPEKNWMQKYEDFCTMMNDFMTEQEYFEYYNKVKDKAIDTIKNSDGFKRFNEEDMNQYKNTIKQNHPNLYKEIYNEDAVGKRLVSFDIKSANFHSLWRYDESIFKGACWEMFMSQFTNYKHITYSKYIRQVILGNCNPSRTITYTGWLAEQMLNVIEKEIPGIKLVNFTTDELVFEAPENNINYRDIEFKIKEKIHIPAKAECFMLRKIEGELSGYLKDIYDYDFKNKVRTEYKGINGKFGFLTIYLVQDWDNTKEENTEYIIDENHLVFNYEGHLCKLLDVPKFTVKEE